MPTEVRIPAYFSHSYRPEDRAVNEFFWRLFWESNFSFTVDPESQTVSIPHLELMMRWSACFVAVVTQRPGQKLYKSSPFVVYEYGLAVRAMKPRLIFVENGVAGHYFPETEVTFPFDREGLEERREEFQAQIERLTSKSRAYSSIGNRTRGPAGLILPQTEEYRTVREAISDLVSIAGHRPLDVSPESANSYQFALKLDECDFVVTDVGMSSIPAWVYPFLQGRFIPTVRLLHQAANGSESGRRDTSLLDADNVLRDAGVSDYLIIRWSTLEELTAQMERQVEKLFQPRKPFRSEQEGWDYFRSLGRRQMSIFISNAGGNNDFASELIWALHRENIRPFHYVYDSQFKLGKDWRDQLTAQLRSTQLFVPLMSEAYWDSEWCKEEYKTARKLEASNMLTIYPYFLDDFDGPLVPAEGRKLSHMPSEQRIPQIVKDIDEYLTSEGEAQLAVPGRQSAKPVRDSRRRATPKVDIAIITVLQEEYAAVHEHLERPQYVPGSRGHPNSYSWRIGEIRSDQHQTPYRVVLGMAGQPGEGSGIRAVTDTIEAFTTDYLLLVGVAGGLGDLRRGDVVVSDVIYGYEYGKADEGFEPRGDWTFAADLGMANAARALAGTRPDWSKAVTAQAPGGDRSPRIHIGAVASGNKVVDNISDPSFRPVLDLWPKLKAIEMEGLGAARAIEWAKQRGFAINFSMVRGISDLPRNKPSETVLTTGGRVSTQTQERDLWKKYAAEAAAVLTIQIIREAWRLPPRDS